MNTPNTPHVSLGTAPNEESLRRGYETRDVNIRVLLWLAATVIAGVLLVQFALWLLLAGLRWSAARSDPQLSPLASETTTPPEPRLQSQPQIDYEEYRRGQESRLGSYGWVDRDQGVVHIPVSRAIDLVLERGLPPRKAESRTDAETKDSTP